MSLFVVVLLHGDMDQFERNKVINAFKKQEIPILAATNVAGKKQFFVFLLLKEMSQRRVVNVPD